MFSDAQKVELNKPLDPEKVKGRQQGGREVSYIEGWHAIAEANRIFGFDGWERRTVALSLLGEPYQTGDKWRVNYSAKVSITAHEVVREGCGFGQGIDKDLGQAYESAIKEAETDAMKRAFMTFGNQFGLALYDKSQANVQAPAVEYITDDQRTELQSMIEGYGLNIIDVCRAGKIDSLKDIHATNYEKTKAWLNRQHDKKMKEAA